MQGRLAAWPTRDWKNVLVQGAVSEAFNTPPTQVIPYTERPRFEGEWWHHLDSPRYMQCCVLCRPVHVVLCLSSSARLPVHVLLACLPLYVEAPGGLDLRGRVGGFTRSIRNGQVEMAR
jgi:hypothetical protein